ncbi:AMP-binding protein [Hydrocarboniphaga effusa]|uniref:AMP-binding protein n=1 Tax=Hydrocarboniphaga effusa TaxID=243629 RepID=UPI00398BC3AF
MSRIESALPATALSVVCGATDVPLLEISIGAAFDTTVRRQAEREALVVRHQGIRWSWAELGERVDNAAAQLLAQGLEPGDRVGIWAPNCAEWVIAQFATAKAGLVLVNINPAYRRHELEYALRHVGCKALILAAAFKSSDYLAMLQDLAPELAQCAPGQLHAARLPQLRLVIRLGDEVSPGMLGFSSLLSEPAAEARARLDAIASAVDAHSAVNIQFTSGTTGSPKGATLTHRNILNNGYFVGRAMRLAHDDKLCIPVPLYHCFGMVMGNLACVTHGACMVFPADSFDAASVLQTVQEERCTALHGVPTMFIAELDHPDFARYTLDSLRTGIMAGAPCPIEVMRKAIERMHLREITIAYGMTETSPVSFQSATDDPLERRVSTIGRVQPHLEVKIVDEGGNTLPRGQRGELLVRGYSVMLGYWNDAQRTADTIDAEGWMRTGDLGLIDEEGYASILGRAKDMVIRGGENVYPREIEEFLYRHPRIRDVQVIGVPDAKFGEELCACVIAQPGEATSEDDIRAFCRGEIAHYKIPRYVVFVDEFPMTVTGKIQKFALRQAMSDRLGLSEKPSDGRAS